jgi:DNA repair protein RadC
VKIKDLPRVDRPREKLLKYGPAKLTNTELLAILLGTGIKGLNVIGLSKKVLKVVQMIGIKNIKREDLTGIKGLGKVKQSQVFSLLELSKRFADEDKSEILSAKDIWKLCADIRSSKKEHFLAFYLDTQSRVIERQVVTIGTLDSSLVHPREVFEPAIALHAASIVIAHNHPSGSLSPSKADIELTDKLGESGKILSIRLENHVLLTEKGYFSFKPNV